jgi:hypothetical protein
MYPLTLIVTGFNSTEYSQFVISYSIGRMTQSSLKSSFMYCGEKDKDLVD